MRDTLQGLARRALAVAAVAVVIGAAACGESPTAPRAKASAGAAVRPVKSGTARRGGYNVVAD